MAKEKILLVDDEIEFTSVLAERMKTRGLEVETAPDGKEALNKLNDASYDAIILDMKMPGMDGIETLKAMLKKNPDLQIILLTGHATLEKGVEAVKLGAVDFIEKPADLKTLLEKIKQASTNKMILVEKRAEEQIKEILKAKGW